MNLKNSINTTRLTDIDECSDKLSMYKKIKKSKNILIVTERPKEIVNMKDINFSLLKLGFKIEQLYYLYSFYEYCDLKSALDYFELRNGYYLHEFCNNGDILSLESNNICYICKDDFSKHLAYDIFDNNSNDLSKDLSLLDKSCKNIAHKNNNCNESNYVNKDNIDIENNYNFINKLNSKLEKLNYSNIKELYFKDANKSTKSLNFVNNKTFRISNKEIRLNTSNSKFENIQIIQYDTNSQVLLSLQQNCIINTQVEKINDSDLCNLCCVSKGYILHKNCGFKKTILKDKLNSKTISLYNKSSVKFSKIETIILPKTCFTCLEKYYYYSANKTPSFLIQCPLCNETLESVHIDANFSKLKENYFNSKIINENKNNLNSTDKNTIMSMKFMYNSMNSDTNNKLTNFYTMINNYNIIPCVIPDCKDYITLNDLSSKFVECSKKHKFCYICKNSWHLKSKCINIETEVFKINNSQFFRMCFNCGLFVKKTNSNCLECLNCKYKFCFFCNEKVNKNHFSFYNLKGCAWVGLEFFKNSFNKSELKKLSSDYVLSVKRNSIMFRRASLSSKKVVNSTVNSNYKITDHNNLNNNNNNMTIYQKLIKGARSQHKVGAFFYFLIYYIIKFLLFLLIGAPIEFIKADNENRKYKEIKLNKNFTSGTKLLNNDNSLNNLNNNVIDANNNNNINNALNSKKSKNNNNMYIYCFYICLIFIFGLICQPVYIIYKLINTFIELMKQIGINENELD